MSLVLVCSWSSLLASLLTDSQLIIRFGAPPISHLSSTDVIFVASRGSYFQYYPAPDARVGTDARSSVSTRYLKDWDVGNTVPDDEVISLADLEEFDHGDLHRLLTASPVEVGPIIAPHASPADEGVGQPIAKVPHKRSHSSLLVPSEPCKRRRTEDISLRGLLPMVSVHDYLAVHTKPTDFAYSHTSMPLTSFQTSLLHFCSQ